MSLHKPHMTPFTIVWVTILQVRLTMLSLFGFLYLVWEDSLDPFIVETWCSIDIVSDLVMHVYLMHSSITFYGCKGNLHMYAIIRTFYFCFTLGCMETFIDIRSFDNFSILLAICRCIPLWVCQCVAFISSHRHENMNRRVVVWHVTKRSSVPMLSTMIETLRTKIATYY